MREAAVPFSVPLRYTTPPGHLKHVTDSHILCRLKYSSSRGGRDAEKRQREKKRQREREATD